MFLQTLEQFLCLLFFYDAPFRVEPGLRVFWLPLGRYTAILMKEISLYDIIGNGFEIIQLPLRRTTRARVGVFTRPTGRTTLCPCRRAASV